MIDIMITFKINNNSKYPDGVQISYCFIGFFYSLFKQDANKIRILQVVDFFLLSSSNLQISLFYIYCSLFAKETIM